jgi:hypothetical protein
MSFETVQLSTPPTTHEIEAMQAHLSLLAESGEINRIADLGSALVNIAETLIAGGHPHHASIIADLARLAQMSITDSSD